MDVLDVPLKLVISFALGAVIGLEREINEQKDIKGDTKGKQAVLGLRTFALVSGLGAITGLLFTTNPLFAGIITAAFFVLLMIFYIFDSRLTLDPGITTEISVIYSYLIGFLIVTNTQPVQVITAITVVLVLLMSRKEDIKNFIQDIRRHEINALISFAILAFVVLPLLPNQNYSLSDFSGFQNFFNNIGWDITKISNLELINPFKLWLIVVLITGVDLLGYVLERTIGQSKGWLVASLVGGFVSSTATTISIAQESKTSKNVNPLLAGAVLATLVSFAPVAMILASLNSALFVAFLPVLAILIVSSLAIGFFFLKFSSNNKNQKVIDTKKVGESHQIFSLTSALRFMGIYLVINIMSKIAIEFFGSNGFLVTSALGSVTGIDAIVINTSQLAGNQISLTLGVWALVLANGVNLMAKSMYSYLQGSKEFSFKYLLCSLVIIASSIIAAFFQLR